MANERDRNQTQNNPSDQKDKNPDRRDPNTVPQGDRSAQSDSQRDQRSQNPGQPDQRSKKPSDMNEDDDV